MLSGQASWRRMASFRFSMYFFSFAAQKANATPASLRRASHQHWVSCVTWGFNEETVCSMCATQGPPCTLPEHARAGVCTAIDHATACLDVGARIKGRSSAGQCLVVTKKLSMQIMIWPMSAIPAHAFMLQVHCCLQKESAHADTVNTLALHMHSEQRGILKSRFGT